MVQKFVKSWSDSAKQPDCSDSAERTATRTGGNDRPRNRLAVQLRRAIQHPACRRISGFFCGAAGAVRPAAPCAGITARTNRRAAYPVRCNAAAEHIDTRSAGTGPTCLCSANRKKRPRQRRRSRRAAAAYHSDRAIGRKMHRVSARRILTHPTRPEATIIERIGTHTAGAGLSKSMSSKRKASGAPAPSIMPEQPRERHVVRSAPLTENATPTHGGCANTLCAKINAKAAPISTQEQGRRAYVQRVQEIPRRKIVCAGSSFI